MIAQVAQQTLFKDLVADLPDTHQAKLFRNLHEAGITPNDVELARLLCALQIFKSCYETIPTSIQKAADKIERKKQKIAGLSSDATARLAGQVIQEAERLTAGLSIARRKEQELDA